MSEADLADLARLRARIDELDRQIVRLLGERAAVGMAIGHAKASAGRLAMRDAEREAEVLRRVAAANDGPISEPALRALYQQIIDLTRGLEEVEQGREREVGAG